MTKPILTLLAAAVALASCSEKKPSHEGSADSTLAPVETKEPNSAYKPAFEGQTRIAGVKTSTPYESKAISDGLKNPWGITSLPDGRLIITEKSGTMRIAKVTGELSEPITGIPTVNPDGQGGLLGIRVDPDFEQNRMIYWVFSEKRPDGNLTAVAKGKLSADEKKIEGATVIYRATPAYKGDLHYGGRILIDKDGNLVVSTGERSDTVTRPQAQFLNSSLGKVLKITKDGKAVAGNPFEGKADAKPEIYSYGHRNVQGLAFHPVTGDLWETEFGPRGGDELNRIEPGKNYGWPTITYGIEYAGPKVGEGIQQKEGLEQPVYYWDPVVSPSGITFYTGDAIPEWKNNLFISGLSSTHIARLVIENNKVVGEERLLEKEGQRFRDITQGKDGALYAITDQGKLYRISKK
ncbi:MULTISPECIES: PQQ-dependent sugar dehydrogenase [unclassified Siphonobacter]|uniref:PQQ-dependent sugar dehydrogenase n=1 Tax=unclassified Siphonobacter TaxID=2635712 RepID=UPI000CA8F395|nr:MULTISPECIES: PQQ-dependent sugar dehydrogenase [unclassified Siphonobacter]MDQ1090355.1 glucose/arabinose dehydrogenase [Siphonobacter sp. SORGH_AS_1065]MDR6197944.1 glucose/arabinose dehydrogenase [Siphonobacter sp. SORGH_AS_0500]PKK37300.1 glucose dehydrogenase [Siphonobacter sp. SORGH_AS_0500]